MLSCQEALPLSLVAVWLANACSFSSRLRLQRSSTGECRRSARRASVRTLTAIERSLGRRMKRSRFIGRNNKQAVLSSLWVNSNSSVKITVTRLWVSQFGTCFSSGHFAAKASRRSEGFAIEYELFSNWSSLMNVCVCNLYLSFIWVTVPRIVPGIVRVSLTSNCHR